MNATLKNALAFCAVVMAGQAFAQVTFYEDENFHGHSFSAPRQIGNLERFGFNDRASSMVVVGNLWEVCDDVRQGPVRDSAPRSILFIGVHGAQ